MDRAPYVSCCQVSPLARPLRRPRSVYEARAAGVPRECNRTSTPACVCGCCGGGSCFRGGPIRHVEGLGRRIPRVGFGSAGRVRPAAALREYNANAARSAVNRRRRPRRSEFHRVSIESLWSAIESIGVVRNKAPLVAGSKCERPETFHPQPVVPSQGVGTRHERVSDRHSPEIRPLVQKSAVCAPPTVVIKDAATDGLGNRGRHFGARDE